MAASSTLQICPNCNSAIGGEQLSCPRCGKFVHAAQLQELVNRARQMTAVGNLPAAQEQWQTALSLLPPNSGEYQAIQRELAQIGQKLNPKPQTDWRKRFGPFGVVIAFLAKFWGWVLAFLLKFKFLFFLLTKGKALLSLFLFFGVYWAMFGWKFAVGLCASIFIHEMGHYVAVKRFGFSAELPMFVPMLGAYVKWSGANVDVGTRAQISLAGPLFGFGSGVLALGLYLATGQPVMLAIAHFAGWINLLNLIPIAFFDGGSAMSALGRQERLAVLVVSGVLLFLLHDWLYAGVAAGTAYRLWKRDEPEQPRRRIGMYFVGLVILNGFLSWVPLLLLHEPT